LRIAAQCWIIIVAVLYVSRGKAIMFYGCTLLFFFFQKVISEVTERISFILSHMRGDQKVLQLRYKK